LWFATLLARGSALPRAVNLSGFVRFYLLEKGKDQMIDTRRQSLTQAETKPESASLYTGYISIAATIHISIPLNFAFYIQPWKKHI
jgi:hypothetical protein